MRPCLRNTTTTIAPKNCREGHGHIGISRDEFRKQGLDWDRRFSLKAVGNARPKWPVCKPIPFVRLFPALRCAGPGRAFRSQAGVNEGEGEYVGSVHPCALFLSRVLPRRAGPRFFPQAGVEEGRDDGFCLPDGYRALPTVRRWPAGGGGLLPWLTEVAVVLVRKSVVSGKVVRDRLHCDERINGLCCERGS